MPAASLSGGFGGTRGALRGAGTRGEAVLPVGEAACWGLLRGAGTHGEAVCRCNSAVGGSGGGRDEDRAALREDDGNGVPAFDFRRAPLVPAAGTDGNSCVADELILPL